MSNLLFYDDDEYGFTLPTRKNVMLVPHYYGVKWARDLNRFLSKVFVVSPIARVLFTDTYLPSRATQHTFLAESLAIMRSKHLNKHTDIDTLFFVNITEDFSVDVMKAGFVKHIFGIQHGTNFDVGETGCNKKLQPYEQFVSSVSDKVFVASKHIASLLPFHSEIVGLPVFEKVRKPSTLDEILFNHRLTAEKNPEMLFELAVKMQRKVIVTAPFQKDSLPITKRLKEKFHGNFSPALRVEEYRDVMSKVGFGISFSECDNFGYSVTEGICAGLCYFVMRSNKTAFSEFMLDELMFTDTKELMHKYEFYLSHSKKREELVREQQKILMKRYSPEVWLNNVLSFIP